MVELEGVKQWDQKCRPLLFKQRVLKSRVDHALLIRIFNSAQPQYQVALFGDDSRRLTSSFLTEGERV